MKALHTIFLATVFAASAPLALAQVSVNAGADTSVSGTVSAGSGDSSSGVSAGVDTGVNANADVGANAESASVGDNVTAESYADLTAALNSSTSTDFSAISNSTDIDVVLISSLNGTASGQTMADVVSRNSAKIDELRSTIMEDKSLNARLSAELSAAGDFTIDDVVAISTNANGSVAVYVDDRE